MYKWINEEEEEKGTHEITFLAYNVLFWYKKYLQIFFIFIIVKSGYFCCWIQFTYRLQYQHYNIFFLHRRLFQFWKTSKSGDIIEKGGITKKRGFAQSSSIGKIVKEQSAENSHPITISTAMVCY